MKYIIVLNNYGSEVGIMFDGTLSHDEVTHRKVISAGFCRMGLDGTMICWGKSQSLNIKCRQQDNTILDKSFDK